MANEVQTRGPGAGATVYFTVHDRTGRVWSTSGGVGGFENFSSADWGDYAISMVEQGSSNFYAGTFPAAAAPGVYSIDCRQTVSGTPLETDPGVAAGDYQWNGSATLPLSDLATSGQLGLMQPMRLAKGVAVSGFMFYLRSAADHVTPLVSGSVSGVIARNGGAFQAFQSGGQFTEVGLGFYRCNLTSGDLNGDTIGLLFTATTTAGGASDPLPMSIVTQRVSGSF